MQFLVDATVSALRERGRRGLDRVARSTICDQRVAGLLAGAHDGVLPIEELEIAYLRGVLELCGGNKVLATQRLSIPRKLVDVSTDASGMRLTPTGHLK